MKKYKLSEINFEKFWSWMGRKSKPNTLQQAIDNDPELKKIDSEVKDLIGGLRPRLLKIKKERPERWEWLVQHNLVPKDL